MYFTRFSGIWPSVQYRVLTRAVSRDENRPARAILHVSAAPTRPTTSCSASSVCSIVSSPNSSFRKTTSRARLPHCRVCVSPTLSCFFPPAAPALIALSSIAYSTACNLTAPHLLALAPPAGWDGPFGQGLTTGTTVVTFIAALILGLGSITVVNTM